VGLAPLAGFIVVAGTTALGVAIVVSITGGFTIDAGPLHVSAHRVVPPLLAAVIAHAIGAASSRQRARATTTAIDTRLTVHALAIAIVLGAASAGVGIRFGTYAVSGADAGGYISQARLLAHGDVAFHEPLIERVA